MPALVVELVDEANQIAKVDIGGVRRNVSVALLEDVRVGDWVLVHVGFAIQKIDEEEAKQTLTLLRQMGQLDEEETSAPAGSGDGSKFAPI